MKRLLNKLIILFLFLFCFLGFNSKIIYGAPCGNGICQSSQDETCSTCPSDCGSCNPSPTPIPPTPTPAPNPTATPIPATPTPAPNPTATPTLIPGTTSTPTPVPTISPSITPTATPTPLISCGNGICETSINETCNSCNLDCGACSSSTTTSSESTSTLSSSSSIASNTTSTTIDQSVVLPTLIIDPINVSSENPSFVNITGSFSNGTNPVSQVEVSFDNGFTWFLTTISSEGKFSYSKNDLDDGTFNIFVRAIDAKGNIKVTKGQTITVDLLPPSLGGMNLSLGPLVLNSDNKGYINVSSNTELILTISTKGGVSEIVVQIKDKLYKLNRVPGTSFWQGKIKFTNPGLNTINIKAQDGANNKIEKKLNNFYIFPAGTVKNSKNNKVINNANISVYIYDLISKSWNIWNSEAYGQNNSIKLNDNQNYSFLLPPGKYYLEASAFGYKTSQSEIINLDSITVVNPNFYLKPSFNPLTKILPPDNTIYKADFNNKTLNSLLINKQAPSIKATTIDKKEISLSKNKNDINLITFLATWSPDSIEQISILENLQKNNNKLKIIAVFTQESANKISTFMKRGGYAITAIADEDGSISKSYNVSIIPYHVFVNSKGTIESARSGILNNEKLIENINKIN